jgi:molybdate transport system substrate-binding protein
MTSSLLQDAPRFLWIALLVMSSVLLNSVACAPRTTARTLTIAAAADLNFAMDQVSREFRALHPEIGVQIDYGSSGTFYTQIRNGAPFDLFLSADVEYPRKLAGDGIGAADSVFTYAVGRIVVWVPARSALEPSTALHDPSVRHVAIANPQHAPYGRAAEAALRAMGLYGTVEKKLVLGENISQTLQFVESGAADVGIVALSLALAPSLRGAGRYWEIPVTAYPKMEQGGIILKPSRAASEFRAFLLNNTGRGVLKQFGFYLPGD